MMENQNVITFQPSGVSVEAYGNELLSDAAHMATEGSPPFLRTLTRRPIEAMRSVHVEAKEVQCGVQAWCG